MSKVISLIIAHCEVCPYTRGYIEGLRCKYYPNIGRLDRTFGRKIQRSELPIPSWCKLPDKEGNKE